jgi:hypothetical protein
MTIHYPQDYRVNDVLVSVDNQKATKVSVWFGDESTARKLFSGNSAYEDAMRFAWELDESTGSVFEMPTAKSVAISLGGATFDDSDY